MRRIIRVSIVSGLAFFGFLTAVHLILERSADPTNAAFALIYGILMASVSLILQRWHTSIGYHTFGLILGIALFFIHNFLPEGNWGQIEVPPEPLVRFVTNTPIHFFGGEIYASTADGALYAYGCERCTCRWNKRDELPPPPDETSYWSGTCPESNTPSPRTLKPRSPGKVIASHATRYCGVDYQNETFFILLEDGSVWVWNKFSSMFSILFSFLAFVGWAFAGGVSGLIGMRIVPEPQHLKQMT